MKTTLIALALMATGVNATAADLSLQLHAGRAGMQPRVQSSTALGVEVGIPF